MLLRTLLFLLLGIGTSSSVLWAQTLVAGQVSSAGDSLGLPYATVSVPALATGVIADGEGRFRLRLPAGSTATELVFSMLGYADRRIDLSTVAADSFLRVRLVPAAGTLDMVEVKRRRMVGVKRTRLGNDVASKNRYTGWSGSVRQGGERGVRLELPEDKAAYLNAVRFHLARSTYDSVRFQLRCYVGEKREGFTPTAPDDVFITTDASSGWVTHDLSARSLLVEDPLLVTLRVVEAWSSMEKNDLHLSIKNFTSPMYYRRNAGDPLRRARAYGVALAFDATVFER